MFKIIFYIKHMWQNGWSAVATFAGIAFAGFIIEHMVNKR